MRPQTPLVKVFGEARVHYASLGANARANRMKVLGKRNLRTVRQDRAANSIVMGPWNLAIVLLWLFQLKSIRSAALFDAGETNHAEHSPR
jgi:hypothetical protein